jgi:hypothetical protein
MARTPNNYLRLLFVFLHEWPFSGNASDRLTLNPSQFL